MPPGIRSRNFSVPIETDANGFDHLEIREPTTVPVEAGDKQYTAQQADRVHHIAHRFWGDAQLFWLLCDANDILDPTLLVGPGTEFRIPDDPESFLA